MTKYIMVDHWGLEVSQAAKDFNGSQALPEWLPASGGISLVSTKLNLASKLLSMDGSAEIVSVTNGVEGMVAKNNADGAYVYTPKKENMIGRDKFEY
jgi:hypothetical protein